MNLKKYFCPLLKGNNPLSHRLSKVFCQKDNQKDIFYQKLDFYKRRKNGELTSEEMEMCKKQKDCEEKLSHVSNELAIPKLEELDLMYGVANSLSGINAEMHYNNLKYLAILGALLAIFFVLYSEIDLYEIIFACLPLIIILGGILKWAENSQHHKNYLEFRVLAESFRVQFFLSIAGTNKKVVDILPWFVKRGVPWVSDVLEDMELPEISKTEKKPILNFWIRNQMSYHEYALENKRKEKYKNDMETNILLYVTLIIYFLAFIFELYMFIHSPGDVHPDIWRTALNLSLGFAAAFTLFLESYYGKKSLDDICNDYERMYELYVWAEQKVIHEGESTEVILDLAREFLIENSTWYAYQNQNKPGFVL